MLKMKPNVLSIVLLVATGVAGGVFFFTRDSVTIDQDRLEPPVRNGDLPLQVSTSDSNQTAADAPADRPGLLQPIRPVAESPNRDSFAMYSTPEPVDMALRRAALENDWSYDDYAANVLQWEGVCAGSLDQSASVQGWDDFCSNFEQFLENEGRDAELEAQLSTPGPSQRYQDFRNDLNSREGSDRLHFLANQLEQHLLQMNEAAILDTVGLIAFSPSERTEHPGFFPQEGYEFSLPTIEVVTLLLMCEYSGGCGADHMLTIRVCTVVPQRACGTVLDAYEAAEYVLTGHELRGAQSALNYLRSILR